VKTHGDTPRRKCPVCGSTPIEPLWAIPFSTVQDPVLISGANTWDLVLLDPEATVYCYSICPRCQSIFQNPCFVGYKLKAKIAEAPQGLPSNTAAYRENFDRWMLPWFLPEYSVLLDAACGVAEYTRIAQGLSQWSTLLATDISVPHVQRARKLLPGVEAWSMDLDDEEFRPEIPKADFIVFAEAAEHVLRPAHVLHKLANQLNPGGRIYWSIQSVDGRLPVRPRECIYASRQGVTEILNAAGLKELLCELDVGRFRIVAERPPKD